jgi:hypothetical protein
MLFLDNKYTKIYFQLIENAKTKLVEGYVERHHIVPKSLGGTDDENNLVVLTARQHFIAHLLLTKMIDGQNKYKMYNAFSKMLCVGKDNKERYLPSSKFYEYSKKLMSEHMTINNPTKRKEVREKMSQNSWSKSDRADEIKKIISEKKIGKKLNLSEEQRKLRSEKRIGEKNGMYGKTHTEEAKQKFSLLRAKEFTLYNVETGEYKKIVNPKKYFNDNKQKYNLFNNCKQNDRLFEGCWKILGAK